MILVTGASGFIGGKLAERLVDEGHAVRCVYRRRKIPEHLIRLKEKGAELFQADLIESAGSEEMLRGVEYVFHIAALASDWGSYEMFEKANIIATENLLAAGSRKGVRKFIILSSISVHGFGNHNGTTEEGRYYKPVSAYQKSKLEMEKRALAFNSEAMGVTIIRPGNVYGPGDHTTMYPIYEAMEKGVMGYLDGGSKKTCPLYIDDLLNAIYLAWKSDRAKGEIFNITGGEDITWKMLLDYSAQLLGVKVPKLDLPGWIAMPVALLMENAFKLFRSPVPPPMTRYRISQIMYDYNFSIDKARRILSYEPVTAYKEGIAQTIWAYMEEKQASRRLFGKAMGSDREGSQRLYRLSGSRRSRTMVQDSL